MIFFDIRLRRRSSVQWIETKERIEPRSRPRVDQGRAPRNSASGRVSSRGVITALGLLSATVRRMSECVAAGGDIESSRGRCQRRARIAHLPSLLYWCTMSKREALSIGGAGVDIEAPRAKRRKEAPATTSISTNGKAVAADAQVQGNNEGGSKQAEDRDEVMRKGMLLWTAMKDAVSECVTSLPVLSD